MVNQALFSSKSNEWATPKDLFDALDLEFGFTLDAAASEENAKCERYFTKEQDGLKQDWSRDIAYCNPPYGREIGKWTEKAFNESLKGATVVLLLPARTDTRWFWDYCVKGEIRFLKGRLKFGNSESGAPFPSMVCIFRNNRGDEMTTYRQVNTEHNQELLQQLFDEISHEERLSCDLREAKEEIKEAQDHAKGIGSDLDKARAKIRELRNALNGKSFGPLFDAVAGREAAEAPAPEPLEISASVDDESLTVKLVRGDDALECCVLEAEKLIFGFNSEAESAVEIAGKINIALQSPDERAALWVALEKGDEGETAASDEIAFSIDEENQLVRLVKGDRYAECSIDEAERLLYGNGADDYPTFDLLVSSIKDALFDAGDREVLWASLEPSAQPITQPASDHAQQESESTENVREFFGDDGGSAVEAQPPVEVFEGKLCDLHASDSPEQIDVLQKAEGSVILKRGKERRKVKTQVVSMIELRGGCDIVGESGTRFMQGKIKDLPQDDLEFLFTSEAAFLLEKDPDNATEIKPKRTRKPKAAEAAAE